MTTRDARSLSPDALEALRRRAVAAVESGVSRAEVARLFGVSRKTVGTWVLAYRQMGDDAFRPKPRGPRPGEQLMLSPEQQAWTVRTIVAGTPDEHGMPHLLWTRQAIAELVNREFRILISPVTVAQYLVRWGLIEEPHLLERMRGRVTALVPRQRRERVGGNEWIPQAKVLWVAWTTPHEPIDSTPDQNLMSGSGDHFDDVNVLLAMSKRGAVYFQAGRGSFDANQVADFLRRLAAPFARGLNVIICRWPAQHSETLRSWPENPADKVAIQFTLD